jgi:glutathione S-transferase
LIRIIGTDASPYTRKVRVVAMEKKIEFEFDVDNPWGAATRVPQFNPLGRIPVLVLEDGTSLYDSRVIAEYLDNASPVSKLIPGGNRERIEVKRWEALADGVLDSGLLVRFECNRLANMRSQSWIDRQLGKILNGITEMERLLGSRPWCTGNSVCLADVCVGCCLSWIDFRFHKLPWRSSAPSLERLLHKLLERPSFAATPLHD